MCLDQAEGVRGRASVKGSGGGRSRQWGRGLRGQARANGEKPRAKVASKDHY